jgi:hypothetical protein
MKRDLRPTSGHRTFAADDASLVLSCGHRSLTSAPVEPIAERKLLNAIIARLEALRIVAITRTAICRARVRSEAHICSGVTAGSAAAELASALRSTSVFSSEEDNLRLRSEP